MDQWIAAIPLPGVFALTMFLVLACIYGGIRLGASRSKHVEGDPEGPIGSVVGAMLGLLAFMLAFTFGISASRFEARKQLLLDDVNALQTAVRRCELLSEPHRSESRELLRQYVQIRAHLADRAVDIPDALSRSETLQDQLWSVATALARADMNSDIGALFVESLNEVFRLNTSRIVVALQYRIPGTIWLGLYLVTAVSMMAVGYQFGLSGRSSLLINLGLAISFSAVVWLTSSLDRSTEGSLRVSQQPMIDLEQRLSQP